jgi:hypothetical protein
MTENVIVSTSGMEKVGELRKMMISALDMIALRGQKRI